MYRKGSFNEYLLIFSCPAFRWKCLSASFCRCVGREELLKSFPNYHIDDCSGEECKEIVINLSKLGIREGNVCLPCLLKCRNDESFILSAANHSGAVILHHNAYPNAQPFRG